MTKFNQNVEIGFLKDESIEEQKAFVNSQLNLALPNLKRRGIEIIPKNNYVIDIIEQEQYSVVIMNIDYLAENEVDLSSEIYEEW